MAHAGSTDLGFIWIAQDCQSDGANICLWDMASGDRLAVMRRHSSSVRHLQFSSNGQWLASTGDDLLLYASVTRSRTNSGCQVDNEHLLMMPSQFLYHAHCVVMKRHC